MRRLFLLALLLVPGVASAQNITSYEVTLVPASGPALPVLSIPALNVSCATGRATNPGTVWLVGTDLFRVVFEPDATRVCTWTGPSIASLSLAPGTLYTSTIVAINEAGLRSDASPASNPFGLAAKPAAIQRVTVVKGS